MKKFSKLAFFDFDGTLTQAAEFIYVELYGAAGVPENASDDNYKAFKAGEISYENWVNRDVGLFQGTSMTKERMLEVTRKIRPMTGAREVIAELRSRGYGIIVVSGGIDIAVAGTFPDHESLFDEVFINKYVFNESGALRHAIPTPYDQKHKATCIKDMCIKYGVNIKDTIFTGDNVNDVEAAQAAGISFAFNTDKPSLIAVARHHIKVKDLREILKYL